MLDDYPLLMLSEPSKRDKGTRNGFGSGIHRPENSVQNRRLAPQLKRLTDAFEKKQAKMLFDPEGMEPELALVFEVAGSLDSFYGAVNRIPGLEWLFDAEDRNMVPDEYFYSEEDPEASITGRVYFVMTDKTALNQLMNTWKNYLSDEEYSFPHGLTSLRDLFHLLRDVHVWGPEDRFTDTGIMDYWRETVEVKDSSHSTFEAELFYRGSLSKQKAAEKSVRTAVESMNGRVVSKCVIDEICYHGLLLELPTNQIELLLSTERDKLALAVCDEVMYYRPAGQAGIGSVGEIYEDDIEDKLRSELPLGAPIVGMLDGLPLENHVALRNRIIVDDPDGFGDIYPVKMRIHGTAMASMLVHGDLAASIVTTSDKPIYIRPVLRPDSAFGKKETYPENTLIIDLIHRAVKRIFDGEEGQAPAAPTLCVINLSIGDESRQFFGVPSSLAKLLDWLSFKYRVLFVISAGNQRLELIPIEGGFDGLKGDSMEARSERIGEALVKNQRNFRILSPAESINSVTVGALFEDNTTINETALVLQPLESGYVSPITSFGSGIGRSIKPEILYPDGKFLVSSGGEGRVEYTHAAAREPGVIAAAPSLGPAARSYIADAGTSYSAAAVSHECAINYDVLEAVFANAGYDGVPSEYAALLLKAMAVHGCAYSNMDEVSLRQFGARNKECTRWIGFGRPDYIRVRECAANRVTAFGYGDIGKDEGQLFHVPLPVNMSSRVIDRRLTVTLAYFTPVVYSRQEYRQAQLWFDRVGLTKSRLVPDREYTDYQAIRRGTLQHQSFIGRGGFSWDEETDGIDILVSCAATSNLQSFGQAKIPYALMVSFETKQPVDIYQPVAAKLRTLVNVNPRVS